MNLDSIKDFYLRIIKDKDIRINQLEHENKKLQKLIKELEESLHDY